MAGNWEWGKSHKVNSLIIIATCKARVSVTAQTVITDPIKTSPWRFSSQPSNTYTSAFKAGGGQSALAGVLWGSVYTHKSLKFPPHLHILAHRKLLHLELIIWQSPTEDGTAETGSSLISDRYTQIHPHAHPGWLTSSLSQYGRECWRT